MRVLDYDDCKLEQKHIGKLRDCILLAEGAEWPETVSVNWQINGADLTGGKGLETINGVINSSAPVSFHRCKELKYLNVTGHISGELDLRGTGVQSLPEGLTVSGKVRMPFTNALFETGPRTGVKGIANRYVGSLIGSAWHRQNLSMIKQVWKQL